MKLIRKKKFRPSPNLADYTKMKKQFKWNDIKDELDWFEGGRLNAAYNAVDRHARSWRKNKVALYWLGEKGQKKKYTFAELSKLSNRFANVLKKNGIKRGDRVFIFLPRVPEVTIVFLGILKLGAIAGTLFSAFGHDALEDRLSNSGAKMVITNRQLKRRVYGVKKNLPKLKKIIIIDDLARRKGEVDYRKAMEHASADFHIAEMHPDDHAFMLYTSGTTGKPKGIVHAHKAILQEHITARWVLDLRDDDVYWCTSDYGWVTGISYEILGPLSVGASLVVYEGRFDPAVWYSIIEKYKVTVWYTAPTAIRMLMRAGKKIPKRYNLKTLRHMCSVGEPLNPEAIRWGLRVFGLPFHDGWWQTETGSIIISNYRSMNIKPGSMGRPFPGIVAGIVDDKGNKLHTGREGNLAIKPPWPSMFRTVWKNRKKYKEYFKKGWYLSGDRALVDKDGYFWFIGRADDVIKTGGERVGPFEVESALVEHPAVAEAGVIGKPDPLRGEVIKAFMILAKGYKPSEALKKEIKLFMKKRLAGHAYPREMTFVRALPKTRSGKIMRRVLKARELGLKVGDTSTLEEY